MTWQAVFNSCLRVGRGDVFTLFWCLFKRGVILIATITFVCLGPRSGSAGQLTAGHAPSPLHVYVVLDDSWSMTGRVAQVTRISYALTAVERWAAVLDLRSSLTVQLITASDHLSAAGTFTLRSEEDRAALIDAIRRIKPVRNSRTNFRAIDAGLAEIARRDTAPGEDFSLVFTTDGISDAPATDLRVADIGDRTINLGGGVSAVLLGTVPGSHLLARRGAPTSIASSGGGGGKRASAMRALRHGFVRVDGSEVVAGTMPARLFGGWVPLHTKIHVDNVAGVARLVRFEITAADGVAASISPNLLVVPAGGSGTVTVELSAREARQGQITVLAHLPDGRSVRHAAYVELVPGSWLAGQLWRIVLAIIITGPALLILLRWKRSAVRIGDHADIDRQAALSIGDMVPLETFAPGATGALRRSWFGYYVLADGQPVSVSGRMIQAGKRGRYRLGEDLRVGDRTFAIFRTDGTASGVDADDFSFVSFGGRAGGGLR